MKTYEISKFINNGGYTKAFIELYGEENVEIAKKRYTDAVNNFVRIYGDEDVELFSVGGRTELMGNHTDHNGGEVIASSINRDIIAVAAKSYGTEIRVKSSGYPENTVNINETDVIPKNYFSSDELIRGMHANFLNSGYKSGAFKAYTESLVMSGSGLSSSAAFEVMIGNIINHLYNDGNVDNVTIAKLSQKTENEFFGKPSGLMDQMACAVGGLIHIDFENNSEPFIEKLDSSLISDDYNLCVVYPGGSHANLNEDYASVPAEMKSVAHALGEDLLIKTNLDDVIKNIPILRKKCGDRAVLRAIHFYEENYRVSSSADALKKGNPQKFFDNITQSGDSSFKFLQNVYSVTNVKSQGLSLALSLSQYYLKDSEAYMRVHGGGFAGTILVILRKEKANDFGEFCERCFGKDTCVVLSIRKYGALKLSDIN